ncbi:MAG: glutamine-hydrolyzing GMP synthase [Candidatus Brocadiaceae bacterium]|nr:glutamine-hydrolyzing GMP synthase [Candidatus Brocadiaceae bacterium]
MREAVAIIDFGSQYTQLIARRVRSLGVYCEILPHSVSGADLAARAPQAVILSGGPASVLDVGAPSLDETVLDLGVPVLGICYGMQLLAKLLGGGVQRAASCEYGPVRLCVDAAEGHLAGCPPAMDVWASHGDQVIALPAGFRALAHTDSCRIAAMADPARGLFGVQFHPEVVHTPQGAEVFRAFLFGVAGCTGGWTMAGFVEEAVGAIRRQVGGDRVLCALSGGVDSTVVAALLDRAVGERCVCVFVDNGLLREGEADAISRFFREEHPVNFRRVDAAAEFLEALRGVTAPEEKRKLIGDRFIRVFRREAARLGPVRFLAQGTLYPDVIESCSASGGLSATIKSHHNVGGLPAELGFELIEPLRELFKDEVRLLGRELGLPDSVLTRQPFPGPGLAVRVLGEVTPEALRILREADLRVQEELERWPGHGDVWQSFAVLLPVKTVGVMGDERTYANVVALRVVSSLDGMTSDWVRVPYDVLERVSTRIINEVRGVNRVVYDVSSKPPSTIEWE